MREGHNPRDRIIWIIFVVILVGGLFTAAFFLTQFIYNVFHLNPPMLLAQLINFFLGITFSGLIARVFSRFFNRQQFNAFQPIILAMERISKGDFNVNLDIVRENGILNNLINSVNKMAQELDQMETMRQEFVSNVSHEIQSPLTSIRGFAQALQDDGLSVKERHHYLEIIETESGRLSRLADDLLKLSSLEAEQVKFAPESYRLDRQIKSTILICEPQWRDKEIEMEVALKPLTINADQDLLNQVWMNLIQNSIKFTPKGGAIRISLKQNGEMLECKIADEGIGISAEDQMHIFERFYKADESRTSSKGGSGLGLSIVKKIVELHKGRIDVESSLGEGAAFIVSLPAGE
jgi:two-component system, OmpR family, phosphate regulon sensor histidine kinase PhoR